jgi:methanethiol oxidase
MAFLRPDPTFYPSPTMAAQGPRERLAYVALLNPGARADGRPDALGVVDLDPSSAGYGRLAGGVDMPNAGDELHHFGWNACSSCLSPYAPHAHQERRYLLVPGLRSSRLHVLDTRADPARPKIVKVLEPDAIQRLTGYSRLHTVHCGPFAIYVSALGAPGGGGPGGVFWLDHDSFEVLGPWEAERGPQYLAYDFWWHLGFDTLVSSEWGTPKMFETGLDPGALQRGEYGHRLHFWDLIRRRHLETVDLGSEQQMVLEVRPAHDPTRAYGFAGVAVSRKDLSGSVWLWQLGESSRRVRKVIEVPAEPARPEELPPILQPFEAVPPLITNISLSVDDRFLYVSCWGTGELLQFNVSDPLQPRKTGSLRLGGIVRKTAHPSAPGKALNGGPQMAEVSRDGRRLYVTNSLYSSWDDQFYPDGVRSWLAKVEAHPGGGLGLDPDFFLEFEGLRAHQVHLEGGDASSDSFCYP